MRLTRAALHTESNESIETADASSLQSDAKARIPLGEVSANTGPEPVDTEATQAKKMPPKKLRKGTTKKGAKGKKVKDAEDDELEPQVLEDERQAAGSPASDVAVEELANGPTNDIVQVPMRDTRPASPPSRAVRMTRRQLAKLEEEELSKSQRLAALPSKPEPATEASAEKEEEVVLEVQQPDTIISEMEEPTEIPEPEVAVPKVEESESEAISPISEQAIEVQDSQPATEEASAETKDVRALAEVQLSHAAVPSNEEATKSQAPEIIEPEVDVISEPEPKTLTNGKSCEEVSTPATSRTPSRATSRSHSKSPMRLEESFEAIDALEEALDKVEQVVPFFDHSADEKSPRKAHFDAQPTTTANKRATSSDTAKRTAVSRNPGVIRSLKPPKMPVRTSLARSSSAQAAPPKERKGSGEVADYLASKRRPISMSFPTPPPPPKSSKPPTQINFQLPGEAVAAKLKAQKEERLRREEAGEVVKQSRPISMPPRPKSTKPPTVPTFQLPGEAVAAKLKAQKEERLRREEAGEIVKKPRPISMPPPPKSTKPPTVANFQLPGEAIAAKHKAQREERLKREEEEAAKRHTFKARPAPVRRDVPAQVRQTSASRARENLMTKENQAPIPSKRTSTIAPATNKRNSAIISRPAFNLSTTNSSNRNSLLLSQGLSIVTPEDTAAQRAKAREQFLKDKAENESKRKERLSKEEAAKKAREEAAERGRIASRMWAEKQRRKMGAPASNGSAAKIEESA